MDVSTPFFFLYSFFLLCAILWVIFSVLLNTSLCSFSSVWNTLSNFLCSAQYFEQDIYRLLSKISIHCWGLILFPNSSSFFIQGKKQEATIYSVKNKKQQSSICFYLCCWRICSLISIFHLKGLCICICTCINDYRHYIYWVSACGLCYRWFWVFNNLWNSICIESFAVVVNTIGARAVGKLFLFLSVLLFTSCTTLYPPINYGKWMLCPVIIDLQWNNYWLH